MLFVCYEMAYGPGANKLPHPLAAGQSILAKIAEDVSPFLERTEDRTLLTREIVLSALRQG